MLRVKEVATAELLTSQLPEVHVVSTVVSSSVSDTNDPVDFADFASRNEGPHRPGNRPDARADRSRSTAQGRGLRAHSRRPAAQDPHAAAPARAIR